jgi:hypothetical protein
MLVVSDRSQGRTIHEAAGDVAPGDWILFTCATCLLEPGAVRAVRCDGSEEVTFGRPTTDATIVGGRLIDGALVVTARGQAGWQVWKRSGGVWAPIDLEGDQRKRIVGAGHLEGHFRSDGKDGGRFIYTRSYAGRGPDAVSFFDVVSETGADFIGQATPGATDLQILFASLTGHRLAYYFYSPTGMSPGHLERLGIYDEAGGDVSFLPLAKPQAIAGTSAGDLAVLSNGEVSVLDTKGEIQWRLHTPAPIDGLTSVNSGGVAFSSGGDLFCAHSSSEVSQLTKSPTDQETLFP